MGPVHIGFGLITAQRHPAGQTQDDATLYREKIELCRTAERSGFDSVWVSEHHFLDDAYMPSLLVTCAAIAQATERVQIGTGVLLAPLHDPIRLAEDAATVDLISGGRLILGLGAGWRPEEFEVFGVDPSTRPSRMREVVEILRGAWSEGTFSFDGRRWSYADVDVTPKPAHPIPIWFGGSAEAAVRRAGRIADGFLGSSTATAGVDAFARLRDIALEGVRESGRSPEQFSFAVHVPVFAWDSGEGWEVVRPWYHYLRWKYPDMAAARGRTGPPPEPPPLDAEAERQLRSSIICGTPDEVVAGIRAYREALGEDLHFICRSDFPGMPHEVGTRAVELLGEKVLPGLRS